MVMKKSTSIIVVVFLFLSASCSKNTSLKSAKEPVSVSIEVPKITQAAVTLDDIFEQPKVNPADVFTVSRDGQTVTIKFLVDFSGCKRIGVARNATGIYKDKDKDVPEVATLASSERQFEDIVPNSGAFYYWLRIYFSNGSVRPVGPLRIAPDEANKGTYLSIEETYRFQINRTYTSATMTWNFPEANYGKISIKRNTNTRASKRATVYTTLEWSGSYTDMFPDPEADDWYWIEATLENGREINQGPFKAEYPSN